MTETLPDRALIVGALSFGLGELSRESGALRARSWAEAPEGTTRRLEDGDARLGAGDASAYFSPTLSPFRFGLHAYDPFESLGASLDEAVRRGGGLALAVWAAMESDLFRFAFDGEFTSTLERYRDSDEWRRFAALNDLYRSVIRAVVPLGVAPPAWSAWLRGGDAEPESRAGRMLRRLLTRPVAAMAPALLRSSGPGRVYPAGEA